MAENNEIAFGGGVLRQRGSLEQFTGDIAEVQKRPQDFQVFDPSTKKSYSFDHAKGRFLMGLDPSQAKNKVDAQGVIDRFAALQSGEGGGVQVMNAKDVNAPTIPQPDVKIMSAEDVGAPKIPRPEDVPQAPSLEKAPAQMEERPERGQRDLGPKAPPSERGPGFEDVPEGQTRILPDQTQEGVQVMEPEDIEAQRVPGMEPEGAPKTAEDVIETQVDPQTGVELDYKGAPVKQVSEELAGLENEAINNGIDPDLFESAKHAYNGGFMTEEQYSNWLESKIPTAEDALIDRAEFPEFQYEEPAELTIANHLNSFADLDYNNMAATIKNLAPSADLSQASSAELNAIMIASLTMDATNETRDKLMGLYGSMRDRAQDAYDATIQNVGVATQEIDNIISGRSMTATTLEALNVKVATQAKELGLTSLEARESAMQAEFESTYSTMLEQNSRLEGYMKAKLNWMGAADSSAGLTLMVMTIDNAQQRLFLYQTKFNSQMLELEVTKTQLLNDYYNSVQEQVMNLGGKKSQALTGLNERLDEIDAQEIASDQEAKTQMLGTLSDLSSTLYGINQDQKAWEYQMATDMYNRALNESAIARDIENQKKAEAATNLDLLVTSAGMKTFDQLDPDTQQAMVDYARVMGLPESFPRQMLETNAALLAAEASTGGGGGGGYGSSSFSPQDQSMYLWAITQADESGMNLQQWLDMNYPGTSSMKDSILEVHAVNEINTMLEQQETISNVSQRLGITEEELLAQTTFDPITGKPQVVPTEMPLTDRAMLASDKFFRNVGRTALDASNAMLSYGF